MSKKRFLKALLLSIMVLSLQVAHAQVKTVAGTVKDDKGVPVPGATVKAKGSTEATTTDNNGNFSLSVPVATTSLVISSVGFGEKIVSVNNATNISIKHTATDIDSVVVHSGYVTQKRRELTSAITHVDGDAIKNLPTQDVATALQGRVAGVEVIAGSGEPGSTAQITIRGVSSLNQPNPLYVVDGVQQQGGNNINPQDIESIDVLKDAAASVIYGAAAAGGVIIITTKKGKGLKPTVSLSTRYGITVPRLVKLLDKADYVKLQKDEDNSFYTNPANAAQIDTLPDFNWEKALYSDGNEQNYNLSISGATPVVNYFISGVYNKQKGVFLDNSSALAGARINTEIKISNAIKVNEQLNVWQRETDPVKTSIVSAPFRTVPTGEAFSKDPLNPYGTFPGGYDGANVVAQIKTANFQFPETNFQGNIGLEIKLPIKYLTFNTKFGYTDQSYQNNLFQQTVLPGQTNSSGNHLYRNIGEYKQILNTFFLAYDHTWGKHTLNLLAGYEQYSNTTDNLIGDVQQVSGTSFGYIPTTASLQTGGEVVKGGYDPNGLVKSLVGRINYDFRKKYIITLTARRDGNFTTFGPGNQYGVFPAISGAWRISDERFLGNILAKASVNSLKFRASYGELGNSNIGSYHFVNTYNNNSTQAFSPNGTPEIGYTQQVFANNNIQWESTHETNLGLDGEMLNGKLYFSVDWYNKNTTNLLYQVPVPLSSGIPPTGDPTSAVIPGTYLENIGTARNRGVDIALGYKDHISQVNYSVNFTGSFNKNKVLNLDGSGVTNLKDGDNNYPGVGSAASIWTGQPLTYTAPGLPFGQFYGYKSDGIISNSAQLTKAQVAQPSAKLGDLMFEDINHDGQIDQSDKTVIGNPYPKFTYGINLTASWRQFDIAALFNGVAGVDIYNGVTPYEFENLDVASNVTSKAFEASGFIHDGVTNGITKYPSIGHYNTLGGFVPDTKNTINGNYTSPSSYFVENGSYFKLKNLQIGYTISSKVLERAKIKSLRVYVMANNVFTITKYTGIDPELGSQFGSLSLSTDGTISGNANGTPSANNGGVTNRGIDGPGRYPNVKLYTMGLDIIF